MNTLNELVQTADERLQDAEHLFLTGRHEWAFYSAGYAVELLLKARIAKVVDFPDLFNPHFSDKEFAKTYKVHNFVKLAKFGGLFNIIEATQKRDLAFEKSWRDVILWNEQARYNIAGTISANQCRIYLDNTTFIFTWIKKHI